MRMQRLVLLTLVTSGMVVAVGCGNSYSSAHERVRAKAMLYSACSLVYLWQSETDEPPPVRLPELVEWLETHASAEESYIDYEAGTIEDIWGNEVVVISEGDEFLGLGSSGPNGNWEGGDGDDIVVMLEEVKS